MAKKCIDDFILLAKVFALNEDLRRLISAKAQVTKVQRKIEEYVAYNRANNIFFDENTDADLQEAREKLATMIAIIRATKDSLKLQIKQLEELRNENQR